MLADEGKVSGVYQRNEIWNVMAKPWKRGHPMRTLWLAKGCIGLQIYAVGLLTPGETQCSLVAVALKVIGVEPCYQYGK